MTGRYKTIAYYSRGLNCCSRNFVKQLKRASKNYAILHRFLNHSSPRSSILLGEFLFGSQRTESIDLRFKRAAQGRKAHHLDTSLHQADYQVQEQSIKSLEPQSPTSSGLRQRTPTTCKSQIPCPSLSLSSLTLLSSHLLTISIVPSSNLSLVICAARKIYQVSNSCLIIKPRRSVEIAATKVRSIVVVSATPHSKQGTISTIISAVSNKSHLALNHGFRIIIGKD